MILTMVGNQQRVTCMTSADLGSEIPGLELVVDSIAF